MALLMFERSADTEAVIVALRGCNDEISYKALAQQSGLKVERAKQVLASARRALRAESGILFGVVRGEGLRRLSDADIAKKPQAFIKRVYRGSGRELKDLATISDFGKLSKTDQHTASINRIRLNAFRQQAATKIDEPKPATAPQPMPNVASLTQMRKV